MLLDFFKRKKPPLPRILFLHIQKTAGASINEILGKYYLPSMIMHGQYLGHQPEEFDDIQCVSAHMGYAYAKFLMPGRFTFTFLRNPNERVLSLYYYFRNRSANEMHPSESTMCKICQELNLHDFLLAGLHEPIVKLHVWNNQVWQLVDGYTGFNKSIEEDLQKLHQYSDEALLTLSKKHLSEFSYIGFTETIEEDIKHILREIKIKKTSNITHINKGVRPNNEVLSTEDKAILNQLTALDWQLYNHAWNLRQEDKCIKN